MLLGNTFSSVIVEITKTSDIFSLENIEATFCLLFPNKISFLYELFSIIPILSPNIDELIYTFRAHSTELVPENPLLHMNSLKMSHLLCWTIKNVLKK